MTRDVPSSGSSSVWPPRRGRSAGSPGGDSGRQAGGLPSAVAIHHKRQVGTPDSQERVNTRSSFSTPPVQRVLRFSPVATGPTSPADSMSNNGGQLHLETNHRASDQSQPRGLCSILRSAEEGHRRAQGLLGRQEAQRIRGVRTLQDGGTSDSARLAAAGRLHDKGRHLRCLPSHPHSSEDATSVQVCMARTAVSVPEPVLRPVLSSKGLHQAHETSGGLHSVHGHQVCDLLGRHPDHGSLSRGISKTHSVGVGLAQVPGPAGEAVKGGGRAQSAHRVFGSRGGLSSDDVHRAPRQDQEAAEADQANHRQAVHKDTDSKTVGRSGRQGDSHGRRRLYSPSAHLASFARAQHASEFSVGQGNWVSLDSVHHRAPMVAAAAHSMEWQVNDTGHSLMGGDHRCSQVRLGGLVETCRSTAKRRGRDPGLLLEQGREKLQQLERTDRHQLHGSGSSAEPARSVSLGGDRQHNFSSIHQPHGGSTLETQLGGQGAVGVLPASQHPVASNSSSRSRQCESRSAEPSQVRPDRLQTETGGVPAHQPSVRPAYYRPDGGPLEHPAAPLHQSISRSAGSRHRYFSVKSDGGEWIYPSSTGSHIKSSFSGSSTRGSGNSSYTKLEGPMVATAPADVNLQTSSAALSSSVAHSRASKGKAPALQLPARSSRHLWP